MIKPICDKCKNELNELGAILFSPPDAAGLVKKIHLCVKCYNEVHDFLFVIDLTSLNEMRSKHE
jgi:hypothetical protein